MYVPSFVIVIITTVLVVNASIITEDPPLCALLDAATQCENSEISKICTQLCTKAEDSPLCILLDAATQCHNAEIAKICTSMCKPVLSKVDGSWGSWESWSSCSKSCGGGTKQRHRYCDDPKPANGGMFCPGSSNSEDSCNTNACPIDDSICKNTILGLQKKVEEGILNFPTLDEISANCTSLPIEELKDCSTWDQLDFLPCAIKLQDCFPGRILPENLQEGCIKEILTTVNFPGLEELIAVNGRSKVGGSWGSWQSWSSCSKSCGEGTKQRHRHCDDTNGGLSCLGLPKSEDSCNTIACVCDPDCVYGECVGTKVCKCNDGWEGDICDNPICHSNCVNGNCTEHDVCTCEDGWEGKLCDEPICDHECENGECVRPNTCECKDGWQGDLCQDSICLPNCLHGNCTNPNECTCDDGWEGDICDEHPICKKTILGLQKKVEEGLFKLPTLDEISANCTSITTEELIDCSTGNQLDFIPCAYKLQDCFPGRILPENLHEGCIKEILTTVKFPGLEELIAGLCNAPWIQIVSECFRIHTDKASWQQARDNCQREGGDLAQPNNLQALRTYLEDNSITQDYWLGGRLNSGEGWYWLSGRAIIDPFSVGQPSGDGDCLDFRSSNNPSLYDHNCAFSQLYICESGEESVINPSTRLSPEYISRK